MKHNLKQSTGKIISSFLSRAEVRAQSIIRPVIRTSLALDCAAQNSAHTSLANMPQEC